MTEIAALGVATAKAAARPIAAVVLAAGRASRFGAGESDSKVTAILKDKPLVTHVVEAAAAAGVATIIVVTGHAAPAVAAALAGRPIRFVHNPLAASGLASSLRAGIAAVPDDVGGAIILLADMPLVKASTLSALAAAFASGKPDAAVPVHAGHQGNPVLISRSLFPAVLTLTGDGGARRLLDHPDCNVLRVPLDDAGILVDVDTTDVLRSLMP